MDHWHWTGKRDNEVCVFLNFALICTQPLQTCTYSYLVPFVTVRYLLLSASSLYRSVYSSNIWPNFNIGLLVWIYSQRLPAEQHLKQSALDKSFFRSQYTYIVWFALAFHSDSMLHITPIMWTSLESGHFFHSEGCPHYRSSSVHPTFLNIATLCQHSFTPKVYIAYIGPSHNA